MGVGADFLIGGLDSLAYTPSVNPNLAGYKNFPDEDGNAVYKPVDSKGNPTTIYSQPNAFQRFISPTARAYAEQNASISAQPLIAEQAQNTQRGLISDKYNAMPDYLKPKDVDGNTLTSDQAWASGYNGNQTPDQLKDNNSSVGEMSGGIIPTQVSTGLYGAKAEQDIANRASQIASAQLANTPRDIATHAANSVNENYAALNLTPLQNSILHYKFITEYGREPVIESAADMQALNELYRQQSNIPAEQKLSLTETKNRANVADTIQSMAPTIADTVRKGTVGDWFRSKYGVSPSEYMGTPFVPETTDTGVNFPPVGSTPHAGYHSPAINKVIGLAGNTSTPPYANGLVNNNTGKSVLDEPITVSSPNAMIGQPARIYGNTNDEATNDVLDRHNKAVDATAKSAKAQKDARIAQLKAEKAEIDRQQLHTGLIPQLGRAITLSHEDYLNNTPTGNDTIMGMKFPAIQGARNLIGNTGDWLKKELWTGQ